VTAHEQATRQELITIQPIPLDQRHGRARDLFTVWFGANLMLLTVVTGGLAVTQFGLSFGWAAVSLAGGNLLGGVFMALHAAQGPRLGVPQMVQTRGQFGSVGSLVVVGIVVLMYLGFIASNLVVGGESFASIIPHLPEAPGIILISILSLIAAIYGYDLIHSYTRIMTYASAAVLTLVAVWIFWIHGLPQGFLQRNGYNGIGVLGSVSIAALWQISYAPYVSDYSRYMPQDSGSRPAFWASYWGCTLGSLLPMLLGATVALALPQLTPAKGLTAMLGSLAPLVVVFFTAGLAAAGAMNLYCGALSVLTIGQTLFPRWSPGARARTICALILSLLSLLGALLGSGSFLANYMDFILVLLYVLVPWTAINLVDYYLLRHGQYDVASFLRSDGGIYGRVNWVAVLCYGIGILVQVPFMATALHTGTVATLLGGADLSWIVGLAITSPVYFWLARAFPPAVRAL
jgi:NCS1 family nucleobase:cation symporter-1